MYPAQTSFIPVQIALARFLEQQGWPAIWRTNYPYWYLGTTPWRYLTGPILPFGLVGLRQLLPSLSFFDLFWGLLVFSWLLGGVGVFYLVRQLEGGRKVVSAWLTGFFWLFGLLLPFLFRFSDGLFLVAFCLLPYFLIAYLGFLRKPNLLRAGAVVLTILVLVLTDTLILTPAILGAAVLLLTQVGWKKSGRRLKQSALLFLIALGLATWWYTPGYWLTVLRSPSFGGKSLASVIAWLGKLLPTALALTLGAASGKLLRSRSKLALFTFYWLFIFGFLTVIRFLSDPDFWLDWSGYYLELQLGMAFLLAGLVQKISRFKVCLTAIILLLTVLGWGSIFNRYVWRTLQPGPGDAVEYRIGKQLSRVIKPGETVMLSGSSVFWLNAFSVSGWIAQVRGGVDRASVDPDWRAAAWEIREGADSAKSLAWLRKLKINYLVVHTSQSEEYYHDFKYPEKFENIAGLEKIYEERGDRIYLVGKEVDGNHDGD